jgi:hypothetical protein
MPKAIASRYILGSTVTSTRTIYWAPLLCRGLLYSVGNRRENAARKIAHE